MPYPRDTLAQLRSKAQADLGTASLLRFSNLRVLADVLAKGFNALFGYLDWIAKNATPFTATAEYLDAWAGLKGVIRKAPTPAAGTVIFIGTATTPIPSGSIVVRQDGFNYATVTSASIPVGGSLAIGVQAVKSGSLGNTDPATPLSMQTPISGVASVVTTSALTGGADLELDPSLRTRMLLAYSQPPQGGALTDYLGWATAVAGVTRAWIAPAGMGPGSVVAYFMMDAAEASHGGFPQGTNGVAAGETRDTAASGDQLAVANALFAKCNVTTLVYAAAPLPNTINLTVAGLSAASSAVQAAVTAAIAGVFLATASPAGVRLTDGTSGGGVRMSDINAAINAVSGAAGFVISAATASAGSASPTSNIASNAGCIPVLGTVTFV